MIKCLFYSDYGGLNKRAQGPQLTNVQSPTHVVKQFPIASAESLGQSSMHSWQLLLASLALNLATTTETREINHKPYAYVELHRFKVAETCTVDFLEFAPIIDYGKLPFFPKCVIKNPGAYLKKARDTLISKTRTLNCVLAIVLLPLTPKNVLKALIKKQMALYPGRSLGKPERHHTVCHTALFLVDSEDFKLNNMWEIYELLPQAVDRTKAVPLFIMFYRYEVNSVEITSGAFVCWYCSCGFNSSRELDVLSVDCDSINGCFEQLTALQEAKIQRGKNILWRLLRIQNWTQTSEPLTVRRPVGIEYALAHYLRAGQNFSSACVPFRWKFSIPSICKMSTNTFIKGTQVYLTGEKTSFHFITADGAQRVQPSLKTYTEPFTVQVWLWLMASILISVMVLNAEAALMNSCFRGNGGNFQISVALPLLGMILEQDPAPRMAYTTSSGHRMGFPCTRSVLILFLCLPCALVLSNAYKAMLQGHYVFHSPFIAPWERLEQLTNFTIFLPMDRNTCWGLNETCAQNFTGLNKWVTACSFVSDSDQCNFFHQLHEESSYVNKTLVQTRKSEMFQNLQYFCEDDIMNIIRENLTREKTAFVTSNSNWNYYWSIFRKEIARSSMSLKFFDNQKVQDDFVTIQNYYEATALSPAYDAGVPASMNTVFSSGIYNLFQRWDIRNVKARTSKRFIAKSTNSDPEGSKGLSFYGSDIGLTFVLLLSCLLTSTCVMCLELVMSNCT